MTAVRTPSQLVLMCVCVSGVSGWGCSAAAAPAGPDPSELPPPLLLSPPQTHQSESGLLCPCGYHVSTHRHTHSNLLPNLNRVRSEVYQQKHGRMWMWTSEPVLCPPAETPTCSTSQCWSCQTLRPSPPTDQVSDTELRSAPTGQEPLICLWWWWRANKQGRNMMMTSLYSSWRCDTGTKTISIAATITLLCDAFVYFTPNNVKSIHVIFRQQAAIPRF